MNSPLPKRPLGNHKIGYAKPPEHSRFRKGRSGNPRGRPRRTKSDRLTRLVLQEAYRSVTVREGERTTTLPAIQAVLRSQVALAAKGNGPAQRFLLVTLGAIEKTESTAMLERAAEKPPLSDLEVARRIAFALEKGRRELEPKKREQDPDD